MEKIKNITLLMVESGKNVTYETPEINKYLMTPHGSNRLVYWLRQRKMLTYNYITYLHPKLFPSLRCIRLKPHPRIETFTIPY